MRIKYFEDTDTMLTEFSEFSISPIILGKKERGARI
jgi:hypothetical protein